MEMHSTLTSLRLLTEADPETGRLAVDRLLGQSPIVTLQMQRSCVSKHEQT